MNRHAIDAKGRLALPARFRSQLEEGSVLTRGADRSLALYPADSWRALCDRIAELPTTDPALRTFRRFLFAEAMAIELDSQGRFLIPQSLRTFAGLEREVVIVGLHTMIEICSATAWATMSEQLDADADAIIARLASMI
jgi:MraZ protein